MRDLMGHLGGEDGENEEAAVGDAREAVADAVDILWEPAAFTRSSVVFTWQSSWRSRHDPFLRRAAAASNCACTEPHVRDYDNEIGGNNALSHHRHRQLHMLEIDLTI